MVEMVFVSLLIDAGPRPDYSSQLFVIHLVFVRKVIQYEITRKV